MNRQDLITSGPTVEESRDDNTKAMSYATTVGIGSAIHINIRSGNGIISPGIQHAYGQPSKREFRRYELDIA